MDNARLQNAPQQVVATFKQFTMLVQDEMALARAEITRNLSRASMGVAFICGAALLALVALNVVATSLVGLLTASGMSLWLSAAIIGGVLLALAVLLALIGKSRLDPEALAPTRTIENVKKDYEHLKEAQND
ncbi:MAG: phage holin family protein [Paracoccaceae bacterium]